MRLSTRRLLDRAFTASGVLAILAMGAVLLLVLAPVFRRGIGAFVFRCTVEHERVQFSEFGHGDEGKVAERVAAAAAARRPVYEMVRHFEDEEIEGLPPDRRRVLRGEIKQVKSALRDLLGPAPGEEGEAVLPRQKYGQTRWQRALVKRDSLLYRVTWDYSDPTAMGRKVLVPRAERFAGTSLEGLFAYVRDHLEEMLLPRWTFYGRFLTDPSRDAHFYGGIWPEVVGTFYLTLGAMLFAVPLGVFAAVYFVEYAKPGRLLGALRSCVSTLAGVPSIVFGLFGLAFFINTIHVSHSKSVLAGALTLGLLVLPTVIRASEEAILSVPKTYREAALSLGATKWHSVMTVVLPAALPGILTGVVISMGRAAGETAPIIFTAAVSVGRVVGLSGILSEPTPALSWNVYNLCTEHEAVDEIRHVQYGMVTTLVGVVLLLNLAAILIRAKVSRGLRGQ